MSNFALQQAHYQQFLRIAAYTEQLKQQSWRQHQSMVCAHVQAPPGVHFPVCRMAGPDLMQASLKPIAPPSPSSSAPTTAPCSPAGSFKAPPGLLPIGVPLVGAPPGLLPPPGLELNLESPAGTDDESDADVVDLTCPLDMRTCALDRREGVQVSSKQVGGVIRHHVQWDLVQFRQRARHSFGQALLSPVFTAGGLSNARLMLFPNLSNSLSKSQSRTLRAKFRQRLDNCAVSAEIKVKAQELGSRLRRFSAAVDGIRGQSVECDFSQQVIFSCGHFNINIADTGVVTVSFEIEEKQ